MSHKTISNWRWWVLLPAMLLLLPVAIVIGVCAALGVFAESADRYVKMLTRDMLNWVKKPATKDRPND